MLNKPSHFKMARRVFFVAYVLFALVSVLHWLPSSTMISAMFLVMMVESWLLRREADYYREQVEGPTAC